MNIREYMTKNVKSIQSDQTLHDAAKLMWEGDFGVLPVLDDQRRVVGMITDRDIAMAVFMSGRPLSEIPVTHSMSKSLVSCEEDEQLSVAQKAMQMNKVRRLPVLNSKKHLSGIISLNDIALAFARKNRGVQAEEIADTLSSICEHRPLSATLSHAA